MKNRRNLSENNFFVVKLQNQTIKLNLKFISLIKFVL